MKNEKIERIFAHLQNAQAELNAGILLFNKLLGEMDAEDDVAIFRRSQLYFVEKSPDEGTSEQEKQGFVTFSEQEIEQMPKKIQRLIVIQKKRCRLRSHANANGYEIRYRSNGYNVSASGQTIDEAKQRFIAKMKTAQPKKEDTGIPATFQAFTEFYFEKFRKRKVATQTYYNDFNRLQNHLFPRFGKMPIAKITPNLCQDMLDEYQERGRGKTANELFSLLSIIFKGAIAHGIIDRNPLDVVLNIKIENQHGSALTKDEQAELLQSTHGTSLGILYALALYTGLRPNELQTARIEGAFIVAVNSKRKNRKTEYKKIPICKKLAERLEGVTEFPKLHARYASTEFKKHCPNHRLYDLRVTFNTRCKELGVAEHARMHFMGHSLGALGEAYTDLSDEYLLKEGKKLDEW